MLQLIWSKVWGQEMRGREAAFDVDDGDGATGGDEFGDEVVDKG